MDFQKTLICGCLVGEKIGFLLRLYKCGLKAQHSYTKLAQKYKAINYYSTIYILYKVETMVAWKGRCSSITNA